MIKESIFENWNWKSLFFGMFLAYFTFAINFEISSSQSMALIYSGFNVFWALSYFALIPFIVIIIISIIKKVRITKQRSKE